MSLKGKGSVLLAGLLLAGTAGISACGESTSALATEMFGYGDEYYSGVESRYTLNYDEMLYDDFTGGKIDKTKWVVSDSVWDQWGTDQNGVRPQNLFLVEDENYPETHMIMRANGSYYGGDALSDAIDGVNTGAGISTVEAMGPGRYEVKMKACPRIGALTSMWLFSWFNKDDGSVQQNEIDIELGLSPNFSVASFTTWTSPSNNSSFNIPVDYYINDGQWHIYSFDWVTDAAVPYVDYFIDGKLVYTIDTNVPTTNATLTLGIWVPAWAGGGICDPVYNVAPNSRMFDSDYAEFSWWRYIPFQMGGWEQRTVENRNYDADYQPEVLTEMPVANKCANGDFEREDESYWYSSLNDEAREFLGADYLDTPWKDFTVTDETDAYYIEDSSAEIVTDPLNAENRCAMIANGGSYGQWLRGAAEGFRYRLTGKFRTENDANACFRFTYFNGYSTTTRSNGSKTIDIGTSAEWKEFSIEFTVEQAGAQSIRYYLENSNVKGKSYFDDIKLVYLGNS